MTVRDIYSSALGLIGENAESESDSDYSERSTYIVAIFCDKIANIDRDYRESHGLDKQQSFNEVRLELDSEFPLCPRFSDSATHYLAAMLVLYEDEALHDRLFSIHCDLLAGAISEIPCYKEKIKNVYRW